MTQTPEMPALQTKRLSLEALDEAHADELFPVLNDPALTTYTGDDLPASVEVLRERYRTLAVRVSPYGVVLWWNWVVRLRSTGEAIDYMQATASADCRLAELAWVIGARWQAQGYAREAAAAVAEWFRGAGATELLAPHPPRTHRLDWCRRGRRAAADRRAGRW